MRGEGPPSGFGAAAGEGEEGEGLGGLGAEGTMPPGFGGEGREGPGMGSQGLEGMQGAMPGFGPSGSVKGASATGATGGVFGGQSLASVLEYAESHRGGTVAVSSQSEAAASIIESGAEVAGIGGFSGKETSVSTAWLEERIESGRIRWILSGGAGSGFGAMPGATGPGPGGQTGADTRNGSEEAIAAVAATCTEVPSAELESSAGTLNDCAS